MSQWVPRVCGDGEALQNVAPLRSFVIVIGALAALQHPVAGQTLDLLVDPDLTVGSGATLAVAAGEAVETAEDLVVPVRLFEEHGTARRSANIAYRAARLLYFDWPQESWLSVANHEVFGHGGRVRELLDGRLWYRVGAPHPYGRGGGATFFELDRDVTVHELQAISIAGMEVNAVAARAISGRAFAAEVVSARTALRYLGFELDVFDYIQKTGDDPEPPGHDVSDFLEIYNIGADVADDDPIEPRRLRRQSLASLANPMIASAVFAIARYVATGEREGPVFAIPVAHLRIMPALRYRLTPFGPEWAITSDVDTGDAIVRASLRIGRAPHTRPFGLSATYDGLMLRNWRVAVRVDGWKHPPLGRGVNPDFGLGLVGEDLEWGGLIGARAESPLTSSWWTGNPLTLIVDARLKSNGFAPGEPLASGLVLRAGLGVPVLP